MSDDDFVSCGFCGEHVDNCKTKEEKEGLLVLEVDNKNNIYTLYKVIDGDFEFIDKSENRDKIIQKSEEIKYDDLLITRKVYDEEVAVDENVEKLFDRVDELKDIRR